MELDTKTKRLRAVLELLEHAECSTGEVIQRLHLDPAKRRSVQRDLAELTASGEIELSPQGRYRRAHRRSALNPVQALAVYSAARMLFHHAAEYNEHYLAALEKLARDLPERARRVALQANEVYKARAGSGGRGSLVFEVVAQAWLDGRVLSCTYQSPRRATRLELEIYFIEVGARNREAYAIGVNRLHADPQPYVYRLSRMRQPTLLKDTYLIPEEFHPMRFLSNAWGIMPGEPVRVELFFSPDVRERVAETYFGSLLEPTVTLHSGHTRVVLSVGGWLELVPWVLGWGGDVEVVSPPELRAQVADALRRGAGNYAAPQEGHV